MSDIPKHESVAEAYEEESNLIAYRFEQLHLGAPDAVHSLAYSLEVYASRIMRARIYDAYKRHGSRELGLRYLASEVLAEMSEYVPGAYDSVDSTATPPQPEEPIYRYCGRCGNAVWLRAGDDWRQPTCSDCS